MTSRDGITDVLEARVGLTIWTDWLTRLASRHPNEKNETDRQAVNQWVRTHFDGVIDFDKVVRDPAHPEMMLPEFDSGDHLHPGPAGFAAMAEAIPVSLFVN